MENMTAQGWIHPMATYKENIEEGGNRWDKVQKERKGKNRLVIKPFSIIQKDYLSGLYVS